MLKSTERLVYIRPDGMRYPLHAPPNRAVLAEEGFGTPPMEYTTDRAPFQHGDSVRSVALNPRAVQLTIIQNFCSRREYRDGRVSLLDALRPNRPTDFDTPGSLLAYLANSTKRQLDVLLDSGPGFAPPQGGWREWSFTEVLRFVAHDPLWYDPLEHLAVFSSGLFVSPPLVLPTPLAGFGVPGNLAYGGTWREQPTIVLTGPIVNPVISNLTTGDVLELTATIPAGNYVTFILRGVKSIVRNDGLNLLNSLSADSDLTTFGLEPDPTAPNGVNQLQVSGSGTTVATGTVIHWYNRYFGI